MRSYRVFCMCAALLFLSACTKGPDLAADQVNDALAAVSQLENGTYTAVSELVKITADGRDITSCSTEKGRFQNREGQPTEWFVTETQEIAGETSRMMRAFMDGEYSCQKEVMDGGAVEIEIAPLGEGFFGPPMFSALKDLLFSTADVAKVETEELENGEVKYTISFSDSYLEELQAQGYSGRMLEVTLDQAGVVNQVLDQRAKEDTGEYQELSFSMRGYNQGDFVLGYI